MRLGVGVGVPMPSGVGVARFSPLDLEPVLWLDASAEASITAADGAWLDGTGLVLPGTTGNWASTPDSAALDITGDIEIVVRVAFDDWTRPTSPATEPHFVDKLGAGFSGYRLDLRASNNAPRLLWGNGSTFLATDANTALPFTDGVAYWLKVEFDVDNGAGGYEAKFYTAADQATEPSVWTQLGSTVVGGSTTSIVDSSSVLRVGDTSSGVGTTGTLYRTIVRDGIGGTTVFDADFTAESAGTLSFTEDSVNAATVTLTTTYGQVSQWDDLSGSGNDVVQATSSLQPKSSRRALNGLNVLDFDDDRLGGTLAGGNVTQPFTLVAVATSDLASSGYRYIAHGYSPSSYLGFIGSANLALGGGVVLTSSTGGVDPHIIVATANSTSSLIRVDGNETTGDAGTRDFNTPFGIGAFSTPASYWNGAIAELLVIDGLLTAAQIAATEQYLAQKWGITL